MLNGTINQPLRLMCLLLLLSIVALSDANLQVNAAEKTDGETAETTSSEKHRTGKFTLESEGVPVKLWGTVAHQFGAKATPEFIQQVRSGKIKTMPDDSKLTYEVEVPDSYKPGVPHGILVHISPSDKGGLPGQYRSLLAKHRLIAIGANDSGNKRGTYSRHSYAVWAIEEIRRRYDVDASRFYLTGVSGGGRVCSAAMIINSDVFTGGIPIIGANPVISMRAADSKGNTYQDPGSWRNPNRTLLKKAMMVNRYAFLEGEKDYNRASTKLVAEGYKKAGFRYIAYFEQPGKGHQAPDTEWFEKALVFLDAPLKQAAASNYKRAQSMEKARRKDQALELYRKAAAHGLGLDWASQAQEKASKYQEEYDAALKAAEDAVANVDVPAFQKALAALRKDWRKLAVKDVLRLTKAFSAARKKKAQSR